MILFELVRDEDESGVSGVGTVAQGVIFDSGKCALTWLTEYTSTAMYDSIGDVVAIHGHHGKTRVVQFADIGDRVSIDALLVNLAQDRIENVDAGLTGTARYLWGQRGKLAKVFRRVGLE